MASLAHQHQELKLKIRLDVKFGHKFAKNEFLTPNYKTKNSVQNIVYLKIVGRR